MSTSLGPAIKGAIVDALDAALAVQVLYGPGRDMDRVCVYGGEIEMAQVISAGRNSSGRTTRDERGTLDIHVRATVPGGTVRDAEELAAATGASVEDYLSLNTPQSTAGDLDTSVAGYTLTSWYDDGGSYALMTYRLAVSATIT